jgi:hypothetical protein
MAMVTKGFHAALAATLCGAVLLSTAGTASAATLTSTATATTASTAAAKAEDAAVAARKLAVAAVKVAADAAAASDAAAADYAAKAALAARSKTAKAVADAAAAKKVAATAKALATTRAAQATTLTKVADALAKIAQGLRDAQAAADAKALLDIPAAPVDLSVLRLPALNDFVVSWGVPTGKVKRYDVTVYADGAKTLTSTTRTSLTITGRTLQTVYRIEVAAKDANENGATSKIALAPAVPGAVAGLTTGATSPTAGVSMSWLPPTRLGVSPVDHYRVQLTDQTTKAVSSLDTNDTSAAFADADPTHLFEAVVTAVTRDGDGLPMTVTIGDLTSTVPRGFTAIRDAHFPTEVNVSWSPPVWQAYEALTGYEVGVGNGRTIDWTAVGLTESVTLPLGVNDTASYYVRAINAAGASPIDDAYVNLVSKTQLPSSGSPVVLSADDQQADVALYSTVGDEALDQLFITATSSALGYSSTQTTTNGSDGVAFRDLANGTYTVTVIGHDTETGNESPLFNGTITVSGTGSKSVESSFDAGVGYWHGVYPTRHLPRVVSTQNVSFDGTGSMAITATWDSTLANITAGTSGRGGIAVTAKQPVTVSGLGRAGAPSDWNMGISWWDASGNQISLVRAKRVAGVVNTWLPSRSTYTAPAGAVSATAFVEIGGLHKGETFYVDGITLTSK